MNIIVPMAGLGERIAKGGYTVPKPLVKVQNKIIVEWAIKSLKLEPPNLVQTRSVAILTKNNCSHLSKKEN